MKIPFHLHCLPDSAPATALLIPGDRPADVLRVCLDLGLDPLPPIYAVADGFVLVLPGPIDRPIAGAIRLHGPTPHLLMPANAELVPPLLPDESAALVRTRGLVLLPGGRVLEYDPACPIALAELVQLEPIAQRPWRALPEAPALAEDIVEMTLLDAGPSPEQVLEAGGAGIGSDEPTLEQGNLPARTLGNLLFSLGKGLGWLGQSLQSKAMANLAAKVLGGAMALAPALSQKLLGDQEAKLRELLRQFRAGDIDQALARALPLGGEPARGAAPAQNAELPRHPLLYSLASLLGGSGGAASTWFTPDQTYFELMAEYRKQAELATRRGDHRRAAFIYARLLNDYASAARVLVQGGLHRDAAILYEKKLRDLASAARAWEAAGEFDRALALYRALGDHAQAGDLLRRIGEEERAVREYQIAATRLLESGGHHYEAGELLRSRAQRPDLALPYYEEGWRGHSSGRVLACAHRLVQHHAAAGAGAPFLRIVVEAEDYLAARDAESTASFFTEVARLAATPALAAVADEARDRALLGIARKMTERAGSVAVANLVKYPAVWPVPLTGDAQYALTQAARRSRPTALAPTPSPLRAAMANVTAACQMPMSGQVALGFDSGEVVCFDPATGELHARTRRRGRILSLAADPGAGKLLILSASDSEKDQVCLEIVGPTAGRFDYTWLNAAGLALFAIQAVNSQSKVALVWLEREVREFALPSLTATHSEPLAGEEVPEAILHGTWSMGDWDWRLYWYVDHLELVETSAAGGPVQRRSFATSWSPVSNPEGAMLHGPILHVVVTDDKRGIIEVAGLDNHGDLNRSRLHLGSLTSQTDRYSSPEGRRYLAFACLRADLNAGVHVGGVDWWPTGAKKPTQTKMALSNPVAAFPLAVARELLVVESDGRLIRVAMPR